MKDLSKPSEKSSLLEETLKLSSDFQFSRSSKSTNGILVKLIPESSISLIASNPEISKLGLEWIL